MEATYWHVVWRGHIETLKKIDVQSFGVAVRLFWVVWEEVELFGLMRCDADYYVDSTLCKYRRRIVLFVFS